MKIAITSLCVLFVGALSCFAGNTTDQNLALSRKLDSIIIPKAEFKDAMLQDVIRFLVEAGKQNDPDKTGVNIASTLPADVQTGTITLSLNQVSLHTVLTLVAEITGLSLNVEKQDVVLIELKSIE